MRTWKQYLKNVVFSLVIAAMVIFAMVYIPAMELRLADSLIVACIFFAFSETCSIIEHLQKPVNPFRAQIERCNRTISENDPCSFEANVRSLLAIVPKKIRDEVIDRSDEYNSEVGSMDVQETLGSSRVIYHIETDYEKLYGLIIECLESENITWMDEQ